MSRHRVYYIIVNDDFEYWDGTQWGNAIKARRYLTRKEATLDAPKQKGVAVMLANSNAKNKWFPIEVK